MGEMRGYSWLTDLRRKASVNTSIFPARRIEQYRPLSNGERLAMWAQRYYAQGHHRRPAKPRVRVTLPSRQTIPA